MQLLAELRQSGMTVRTDGVTLYVKPNPSDAGTRERLRQCKAELIELLKGGISQYTLDYKNAAIPPASTAEALAHDLVKLCTQYNLNLHATPEGIFLEVTAGDWRAVMAAIEADKYHHVV
jgi:hypothetical protein